MNEKILALVNAQFGDSGFALTDLNQASNAMLRVGLLVAVERHEALEQSMTKTLAMVTGERDDLKQELQDFKQQVSDVVHHYVHVDGGPDDWEKLNSLIIPKPKPDPLFDVLWDLGMADDRAGVVFMANRIREALTAHGLEIRSVE